jgi:hypothetical protein
MRYVIYFCLLILSLSACGKPILDKELNQSVITEVDSYKTARLHLFGKLHYNNGIITDVYCGESYDRNYNVCPTCIPDPKFLNCEHTFPQSKFGNSEVELKKIDLHHLFPVVSSANSARSNLPFGEVDGEVICGTAKRGIIKGTNVLGFEPPDNHKGNVARAMFYFSLRYNMRIDSVQEKYLRKWHRLDRIDAAERRRNSMIRDIQGSTNPFIDDPTLIDQISDL